MVNRVCTLTERAVGTPIYTQTGTDANGMPIYEQTGFNTEYYLPRKNQFPEEVKSIDIQGNTGFYVGYRNGRKRGRHLYIMFRHSTGLYVVWCRRDRATALEAAPINGMRFYQYVRQPTHDWRIYSCTGRNVDLPVDMRQFSDVVLRFTVQPPAVVDADHLWTPADYPSLRLRKVVPVPPSDLGVISLTACCDRATDEADRASEDETYAN